MGKLNDNELRDRWKGPERSRVLSLNGYLLQRSKRRKGQLLRGSSVLSWVLNWGGAWKIKEGGASEGGTETGRAKGEDRGGHQQNLGKPITPFKTELGEGGFGKGYVFRGGGGKKRRAEGDVGLFGHLVVH